MNCPICRKETKSKYCPDCGASLADSAQPSPPPANAPLPENSQQPSPPATQPTTESAHYEPQPPTGYPQSPPAKKPFFKRKWLLAVCLIAVLIITGSVVSAVGTLQDKIDKKKLSKNADMLLEGMVEIPETYRLPREHVEATFTAAGLSVQFVVANIDDIALRREDYIHKGECDDIDTSQPAVQYFDVKDVGLDRSGYYAKEGATIIIGYSDHDFDGTLGASSESESGEAEPDASVESESNDVSNENHNAVASHGATVSDSPSSTDTGDYSEINARLQENLELFRGWAFGTLDSNGNPVENGEPFPEYVIWAFIYDMTYDGSELAVQVRGDFLDFSEDEKNWLAENAQSSARAQLKDKDFKPPFTTIYNGNIIYGRSRAFDVTEFMCL